jgi:chaperone required for assembly of F1-ATPase
MAVTRNRFYKDVSVDTADGLHRVKLDGKVLKTPGGAALALPSAALAEAIADEWRAQEVTIQPQTMLLTKLANTAIDRVASNPAYAREQLLSIAKSDVVCYRATSPSELVERQALAWDPLVGWIGQHFGASLRAASSLTFIEQDQSWINAVQAALSKLDAFSLAGLYAASSLCGSLVIALALSERTIDPEQAFAAANLDKIYQAERWGWDPQESAKAALERAELNQISRFLELLR